MSLPLKYDAARAAIAECKSYDEVRDWADKAAALQEYARRAGDRSMEEDCAEIRVRAARRQGELIGELRAAGKIRDGAKTVASSERLVLADLGIDRRESMLCQRVAAIPAEQFEARIVKARAEMSADNKRHTLDVLRVHETKAEHRAARERDLAAKITALPTKRYGVILADPEWRFEPWSRETGMDRAADNHYPTSELCDIAGRDVRSIAADDCVLFLWATVPMLPQALYVMERWGFEYKSHLVWIKGKVGTGYWFRNAHELLLLGTRGSVPAPAPGAQIGSIIEAPAGAHSSKPEMALIVIERYFPSLPKIELNRRGAPRPGWDAWGNESEPMMTDDSASHLSRLLEPNTNRPSVGSLNHDDWEIPECLRRDN